MLIRDLAKSDVPDLFDVETRATLLLAAHFPVLLDEVPPSAAAFASYLEENRTRVAVIDELAVGFSASAPVGGHYWLKQLSVDPRYGRRGIGSALVEDFAAAARSLGYRRLALSTFRDVPFNGPFYARRGFAELPLADASQAVRAQFLAEVPGGIDPATRHVMVRAA